MANSEGTFGGNGSVVYSIEVHNAKTPPETEKKEPNNPSHRGYIQRGADDSEANGKFEVMLRGPQRPNDRDELVKGLEDAAQAIRSGAQWATFTLVIEDDQSGVKPSGADEQIRVKWPSHP